MFPQAITAPFGDNENLTNQMFALSIRNSCIYLNVGKTGVKFSVVTDTSALRVMKGQKALKWKHYMHKSDVAFIAVAPSAEHMLLPFLVHQRAPHQYLVIHSL